MEHTWSEYRAGLFSALGPDPEEPRLEYAAEHNLENNAALEQAAKALTVRKLFW